MVKMNRILAEKTVKRYVCSNCWGHLIERFDANGSIVECHSCGDETSGFVTKSYAERRQEASVFDLRDAKEVLVDLGIIENPHAGKSTEQLLKEMGF